MKVKAKLKNRRKNTPVSWFDHLNQPSWIIQLNYVKERQSN